MYTIKEKPEDFIVNEIPTPKNKGGEYSYYLLKKKGMNTLDAVHKIAKRLKIKEKNIGFAGLKDKQAITTQYITIKNGPEKLEVEGINIEYIGKVDKTIFTGDLEGNEFEIIVKSDNEIKKKENFVNYYGEQRFGKNNVEIGRALIKRDYKQAVSLIDDYEVKEHIENYPNDYVGAIRKVKKRILIFYVHAYQSYLWNECAKEVELNKIKAEKIPLIGFDIEENEVEYILEKIMKKEGIKPRDFIFRDIKEISSEGGERKFKIKVDVNIEKLGDYKLKFKLPKARYATEIVRQLCD